MSGSTVPNSTIEVPAKLLDVGNALGVPRSTVAQWLGTESALVFTTGHQANLGALGTILGRGDTVIADSGDHAKPQPVSWVVPLGGEDGEVGDAEEPDERQPVVAPAVLVRGRVDADREGQKPGEDDGENEEERECRCFAKDADSERMRIVDAMATAG